MVVVMLLFTGEVVACNFYNKAWYNNSWGTWTDYDNRQPENQWIDSIDKTQYQAILTFPVFNAGSEMVWIGSRDNMFANSALLSLRTGLPLVCHESARSVIPQAWNCVAISRTAWMPLLLPEQFPDKRPLLLAVTPHQDHLSDAERRLLAHAKPIIQTEQMHLFSLPVEAFTTVVDETRQELERLYNTAIADSAAAHLWRKDTVRGDIHKWVTIYDDSVPFGGDVEISFWMSPVMVDQYSRSTLKISLVDSDGNAEQIFNWGADVLLDIVDPIGDEGLFRHYCTLPEEGCRLRIEMRNREMRPSAVSYYNLLVRPYRDNQRTKTIHRQYTCEMKRILAAFIVFTSLLSCGGRGEEWECHNDTLPAVEPGYVGLEDGHFVLNGEEWYPLMLNYKAFIDGDRVVPAPWYTGANAREHFDTIAAWGFNAVRVCLDVLSEDGDTVAMYRATRLMVQQADSAGLHVMLLIKPPFEPFWQSYTQGLLRHLADLPALWAYDFMNEPLYFDPEQTREKIDAMRQVSEWRHWVRLNAPHQLFTVALSEPIEVFEWDPSMLPVDFVEMHTYHPLRVRSEMWWYSHYCGKPWMVGETGLPADNDSVPYQWQTQYMLETYRYARICDAIGYGWWEFQDCPEGVNFEAQYTGLRDSEGVRKPAAHIPSLLGKTCLGVMTERDVVPPVNYYNMLAYTNIRLSGVVVDEDNDPVEGAVVRGWNENWAVGMNTYTDSSGHFTLFSNDYNVHFEVSAPGMSREKFDRFDLKYRNVRGVDASNLPDRDREYQQIDYRQYMNTAYNEEEGFSMEFDSSHFVRFSLDGDMGKIKLKTLSVPSTARKMKKGTKQKR